MDVGVLVAVQPEEPRAAGDPDTPDADEQRDEAPRTGRPAERAEAEKWVQSHIRLMNLDSDGMSACILHRLDDKEEDP